MIKMNMPLEDGKVTFNSTLFGLVKAALNIDCSGMYCILSNIILNTTSVLNAVSMCGGLCLQGVLTAGRCAMFN